MPRDLRKYARQTNLRLMAGGLLIIAVIGSGLIYSFYGPAAAVTGVLCLVAGLSPLILIAVILWGMDWLVKRQE